MISNDHVHERIILTVNTELQRLGLVYKSSAVHVLAFIANMSIVWETAIDYFLFTRINDKMLAIVRYTCIWETIKQC